MHLIHEATVKNPNGVIDIHLYIVNDKIRRYVYHLSSEWAARKFFFYYKKGRRLHGTALSYLNKFKIKESDN